MRFLALCFCFPLEMSYVRIICLGMPVGSLPADYWICVIVLLAVWMRHPGLGAAGNWEVPVLGSRWRAFMVTLNDLYSLGQEFSDSLVSWICHSCLRGSGLASWLRNQRSHKPLKGVKMNKNLQKTPKNRNRKARNEIWTLDKQKPINQTNESKIKIIYTDTQTQTKQSKREWPSKQRKQKMISTNE